MPTTMEPPQDNSNSGSFWNRLKNHPRWHVITESRVLAALLLAVTLLYVFIELADDIMDSETASFDVALLRFFRDEANPEQTIGPAWLQIAALDATALGGTTVLIFVVLVTLGFLWIAQKRKTFFLVLAAAIGGQIFNSALKEFFSRPRPSIVPHLAEVHSPSFPSGHSMMSAVVYLTLGALISRLVARPLVRAYIMSVALLLTLIVGATRVFLGVHYPTDVLAGWSAGLAWALICLLAARILQHKGKVELPGETTEHPIQELRGH